MTAQELKQLRNAAKLTQQELGAALFDYLPAEAQRVTIARWECTTKTGRAIPRYQVANILRALGK